MNLSTAKTHLSVVHKQDITEDKPTHDVVSIWETLLDSLNQINDQLDTHFKNEKVSHAEFNPKRKRNPGINIL